MLVQPYLFFEGRCEEAIALYREVLGAEVQMLMRMKDSPDPHPEGMMPPGTENKVMHMSLRIGDTVVMGSDGHCSGKPNFGGFSLSVTGRDVVLDGLSPSAAATALALERSRVVTGITFRSPMTRATATPVPTTCRTSRY